MAITKHTFTESGYNTYTIKMGTTVHTQCFCRPVP